MKPIIRLSVTVALLVSIGASTSTAQEPEYDMGIMQMVFLRADGGSPKGQEKLIREHRARVAELVKTGQCALAAEARGGVDEILVFKTQTLEEVGSLVASLPGVKGGLLRAETLAWFAARNFIRKPSADGTSSNYVFGLLVRGPNWTAERTPETEKIQKGHMDNINRLAGLGKLVLAGPFEKGDHRRGVFFFKVETVEEAEALADTDPAVIAGRLRVELTPVTVAAGILQ